LQTLDISYNSVYDQSPGSGLTNCLALSQLPALVYLYASFSGLSDLTPLANLTNLTPCLSNRTMSATSNLWPP